MFDVTFNLVTRSGVTGGGAPRLPTGKFLLTYRGKRGKEKRVNWRRKEGKWNKERWKIENGRRKSYKVRRETFFCLFFFVFCFCFCFLFVLFCCFFFFVLFCFVLFWFFGFVLFSFLFCFCFCFAFHFSKPLKFVLGLPKWEHFTPGEKSGKMTLSPLKNIPLTPLVTRVGLQ